MFVVIGCIILLELYVIKKIFENNEMNNIDIYNDRINIF